MKEPKNLKELRDNLQSSFDKASIKDNDAAQIRARVYETILNSVNKLLSGETVKLREDCRYYKDDLCDMCGSDFCKTCDTYHPKAIE